MAEIHIVRILTGQNIGQTICGRPKCKLPPTACRMDRDGHWKVPTQVDTQLVEAVPSHHAMKRNTHRGSLNDVVKNPGVRSLALGLCLCLLYVGYELARACTISLFTARAAGLNGVAVAIAGFLFSIASLALYGRGVEVVGASWTLFVSASVCCFVFVLGTVGLFIFGEETVHDGADGADRRVLGALVLGMFAFREAYVTVVGTQIWALLSADLKGKGKDVSRCWFCIIQVRFVTMD